MKKTKFINNLLGLLILSMVLVQIPVSNSATLTNNFNFSPSRPGIEYKKGMQGLDYVSFNNFINNPNIATDVRGACIEEEFPTLSNCPALPGTPGIAKTDRRRGGDERVFMTGKICPGGTSTCSDAIYYNQVPNAGNDQLKENDVIRLALYFHNNAADPFFYNFTQAEKDQRTAKNVTIGIDLNNIIDPSVPNSSALRPKGFISATNNTYKTSSGTIIKDSSGNPITTALDDIQVITNDSSLYLSPVQNSAQLWMYLESPKTETDETVNKEFLGPIGSSKTLNFTTSKSTDYSINVTQTLSGNKLWLTFDTLPGCFGYSGFAFFDVVVKKNVCTDLQVTQTKLTNKLNGKTAYEFRPTDIAFTKETPTDTKLKWTFTNNTGTFYVRNPSIPGGFQAVSNPYTDTYPFEPIIITDDGANTIRVETTNGAGVTLANACKKEFQISPSPVLTCNELTVTQSEITHNGTDFYKLTPNLNFKLNGVIGNPPDNAVLKFIDKSPEKNGKFYEKASNGGIIDYTVISGTERSYTMNYNDRTDKDVYYTGNGPVEVYTYLATSTDPLGTRDTTPACQKVIQFAPKTNICTTFTPVTKTKLNENIEGKTLYELKPGTITFSPGPIPSGAQLKWYSNTNLGKFYQKTGTTYTELPNPYYDTSRTKTIYFATNATIGIQVSVVDGNRIDYSEACKGFVFFSPEAQICQDIKVISQNPIYTNTVTPFSASATDTKNNQFGAQITYTVDQGYGFFSTSVCDGWEMNTAPKQITFLKDEKTPLNKLLFAKTISTDLPISTNFNTAVKQDLTVQKTNDATTTTTTNKIQLIDPTKDLTGVTVTKPDLSGATLAQPNFELKDTTTGITLEPTKPDLTGVTVAQPDLSGVKTVTPKVDLQLKEEDTGIKLINPLFNTQDIVGTLKPDLSGLSLKPLDLTLGTLKCDMKTSLTVNQNETVYFHAFKEGQDVIQVRVNDTTIPACRDTFDITEKTTGKFYCLRLNVTYTDEIVNNKEGYKLTPNLGFMPPAVPQDTQLVWTSADPQGKFYLKNNNTFQQTGTTTATTLYQAIYYVGNGPVSVKTYDGAGVEWIKCNDSIEFPKDLICTDLALREWSTGFARPINILEQGKMYELTADATYSQAVSNPMVTYTSTSGVFVVVPSDTQEDPNVPPSLVLNSAVRNAYLTLANDTLVGKITTTNVDSISTPLTVYKNQVTVPDGTTILFITYNDAPATTDGLSVNATGRNETVCSVTIPLGTPGVLICLDLNLRNWISGYAQTLSQIEAGNLYVLTSEASYSRDTTNPSSTFTSHSGVFVVIPSVQNDPDEPPALVVNSSIENAYITLANDTLVGKITSVNANSIATPLTIIKDRVVIADGEKVLFITYKDAGNTSEGLSVQATGRTESACLVVVPLVGVPLTYECTDLRIITPEQPWESSDDQTSQRFEIRLDTTPPNNQDKITVRWEATDGTWSEGDTTTNKISNTLRNFEPGTRVEIWAENYKSVCYDTVKAKEQEEPELEKEVFIEDNIQDADDLVNIGAKDDYVTYIVKFKPGNSAKSAYIREKSIENGEIEGSLGGALEFNGMRINVIDGSNKFTMFRDGDYSPDDYRNNPFSDVNFKDGNKDISFYEDEYSCENNPDDFCIDAEFENLMDDFSEDNIAIKFDNIDKLDDDSTIIVKYQMENNSKIKEDPDICKNLDPETGCGEKFENEAEFEAWDVTGWEGNAYWDNSDDTELIMVCPYILTRTGGDTFFTDLIDLGIDIGQCSEVTSTPVIIKEVIIKEKITSTGQGDGTTPLLSLPSHDVCKFSNESKNVEGYNDVLKNFSSSVCEMEAEVSKIWTEENINKAISANITRIARWGGNLNNISEIKSIQDLDQNTTIQNKQSGVFVKDNGDLTLDLGNNVLQTQGKVPAAMVFIVKNHNLIIKSDLKYASGTNYLQPKTIPSAAYIVIDGNIIVDNSVKQIDGIVMAVNLSQSADLGKVTNQPTGTITDNILTINGSLIGNVFELFQTRQGVGDPKKDEGSVTIKYDERILLNTPPGLNELIDITQLKSL